MNFGLAELQKNCVSARGAAVSGLVKGRMGNKQGKAEAFRDIIYYIYLR